MSEENTDSDLPKNKIIQGDCLEVMKGFPDESVDCVITDPPYNIGGESSKITKVGEEIKRNTEALGDWDNIPDYLKWTTKWLKEVYRVCKGGVFSFFDLNEIGKLRDIGKEIGFYPKTFFVMVKDNPIPHFHKSGYRNGFEMGLMLMKNEDVTFNFLSQEEMINVKNYTIGNKKTEHPTEKPESIIKHLVKVLSNDGDLVLDPFLGSGTTCIATKKLNRDFIGIEKEEKYVKIARERLKKTMGKKEGLEQYV